MTVETPPLPEKPRTLRPWATLPTFRPRLSGLPALALLFALLCGCGGSPVSDPSPETDRDPEQGEEPRGLRSRSEGATSGYVLYAPLLSGTTYLIDLDGQVVHTWEAEYAPSASIYFLDNGNLVRTARVPDVPTFKGGGQGGGIQEFTWEGELVWEFFYASDDYLLHHDIEPLPSGNFLAIAWERKTVEEARKAGRRAETLPETGLWPDMILEIQPTRPKGARIVWEWHAWDHLIQDADSEADNYGDPSTKPWRIDINGDGRRGEVDPDELEQLQALGYVPDEADTEDLSSDLFHTNSVAYNAELDQIALSTPNFNEIWIIDHSTTSEEAAGSVGGRAGRGGDLLYRWGNPQTYGRGGEADRKLFAQHDVRWVPNGFPGAGNLTVFNNGLKSPQGDHSAVFEIVPPMDSQGRYPLPSTGAFLPETPVWTYMAPDKVSFYSSFISGAERMVGGNTLICAGAQGRFLEVTPEGEIVWEYWTPFSGSLRSAEGTPYRVFRALPIPPEHPGLQGRDLTPLDPQPAPVKPPPEPEEDESQPEG